MGFSDFTAAAEEISAEQLTEDRAIITPNGPLYGREGDWEVRSKDGNVRHFTDEEFQDKYGSGSTPDESSETLKETTQETQDATGGDKGDTGKTHADQGEGPEETETETPEKSPPASKSSRRANKTTDDDERFPKE